MSENNQEPTFNPVAEIYDNAKFLYEPADRTVMLANLNSGQRVLDIACGTGRTTISASKIVGNEGKVIGIDIADKMLEVAKAKAISEGLSNVDFVVKDAQSLEFNDGSFDSVICALGIFFIDDIPRALSDWRRVLKMGGTIVFSSFGETALQPHARILNDKLSTYGESVVPSPGVFLTNTTQKCLDLLMGAGFNEIEITTQQFRYYFKDLEDYWCQISNNVNLRPCLNRLTRAQYERVKEEHFSEIEPLHTEQGVWIDVTTHLNKAKK